MSGACPDDAPDTAKALLMRPRTPLEGVSARPLAQHVVDDLDDALVNDVDGNADPPGGLTLARLVTAPRALTLRQPWASLVALGVKTIETRSWSTSYRGPLAIHAGKQRPRGADMKVVADQSEAWHAWYDAGLVSEDGSTDDMPFGVVVAICMLVDVVPIVGGDDVYTDRNGCRTGKRGFIYVRSDREALERFKWSGTQYHQVLTEHTTTQRPYGDFRPGRYAWLLSDVKPVDPPVPARGRQGLWAVPDELAAVL